MGSAAAAVRTGAVLLALSVPTAPFASLVSVPFWSVTKVLRRIDGARVDVGTRTVKIDSDTALCAGRGRSIVVKRIRRSRHFVCTYTTFTNAGVDRDLDFRVRVLGARRYKIYDPHWVVGGR
jgi:hypothetical protein